MRKLLFFPFFRTHLHFLLRLCVVVGQILTGPRLWVFFASSAPQCSSRLCSSNVPAPSATLDTPVHIRLKFFAAPHCQRQRKTRKTNAQTHIQTHKAPKNKAPQPCGTWPRRRTHPSSNRIEETPNPATTPDFRASYIPMPPFPKNMPRILPAIARFLLPKHIAYPSMSEHILPHSYLPSRVPHIPRVQISGSKSGNPYLRACCSFQVLPKSAKFVFALLDSSQSNRLTRIEVQSFCCFPQKLPTKEEKNYRLRAFRIHAP